MRKIIKYFFSFFILISFLDASNLIKKNEEIQPLTSIEQKKLEISIREKDQYYKNKYLKNIQKYNNKMKMIPIGITLLKKKNKKFIIVDIYVSGIFIKNIYKEFNKTKILDNIKTIKDKKRISKIILKYSMLNILGKKICSKIYYKRMLLSNYIYVYKILIRDKNNYLKEIFYLKFDSNICNLF